MDDELAAAYSVLVRACASLVADLPTHQQVQASLDIVRQRLENPAKLAGGGPD